MLLVNIKDAVESGGLDMESIRSLSATSSTLTNYGSRIYTSMLIGEVRPGVDGLSKELIVIAAECCRLAWVAIETAANYATGRVVLNDPIGAY